MPRNKEFDYHEKLKAARNLFWEKGYQATSMNDLVDRLGINRSSIYDSYGNKHNLFLTCLQDYIQDKEDSYRASAQNGTSALEGAVMIIKNVVRDILIDTKTCLAINSTFEMARIDEDVRKLLKQQALVSIKLFEDLFSKAQQQGELAEDKSPSLLAFFVVTSFASLWNADLLFNDKKQLYLLLDLIIKFIRT